ncbi:MAG: hypothetical protein IT374_12380 [Polyangiaceae bacterium]|nr:hypothetical protein [Polyangiaceae bacterium]
MRSWRAPCVMIVGFLAGCGGADDPAPTAAPLTVVADDRSDVPIAGLPAEWRDRFLLGDALFDQTNGEAGGLGPLFIRSSCGACHALDSRGPGFVEKFPATTGVELPYGVTRRPFATAGAKTPIETPPGVAATVRLPPPVFGRGYVEAIEESEILRVEAEQAARTDGIRGRAHRLTYASELSADPLFSTLTKGASAIGRFGLKARVPTLDDFAADAYQGDMGLTSPLRPTELPNPDGLTDDDKPGVDLSLETISEVAAYMRLLAIPKRPAPDARGAALFAQADCAVCHVPTLRTRADWPVPAQAGIDAPVYTDLLLHDMGDGLADGVTDLAAGPRDWKTPPLMGLRLQRALLHDGRAKTVEDAIAAHDSEGSEARGSAQKFRALSGDDRAALLTFVSSL